MKKDGKVIKTVEVRRTKDYEAFKLDPRNNPKVNVNNKKFTTLLKSIEEKGLIYPILVKKVRGKLVILDGQRRYYACRELNASIDYIVAKPRYGFAHRMALEGTIEKRGVLAFVQMGAARKIGIFQLIERLLEEFGDEYNGRVSAIFDTVFTIAVREKEKLYSSNYFLTRCKLSPKIANNAINKYKTFKIGDDMIDEIYSFIRIMSRIVKAIDKNFIRIFFNREFLNLLVENRDIEVSPEEVAEFLEDRPNYKYREMLREALSYGNKKQSVRSALIKIESQILTAAEKKERAMARRAREAKAI